MNREPNRADAGESGLTGSRPHLDSPASNRTEGHRTMTYSPGDYPLPSFAAYIWMEGHEIVLGLPPQEGHERGHQVRISTDKCSIEQNESGSPLARQLGWKALLDLLRERSRAGSRDRFHVATKADPTQMMIEAVLRSNSPAKRYDEQGNRAFGLSELGTDDDLMPREGDEA